MTTFDIFETLLIRLVASPVGIFEITGQLLVSKRRWLGSPAEFRAARIEAEKIASASVRRHPSLSEIYELGSAIWSERLLAPETAWQEELLVEAMFLRPLPVGVSEFKKRANPLAGNCFVSDMYLSSAQLSSLLSANGILARDEEILVSNEHGCSKRDGGLFKLAQRKYPGKLTHIGNCLVADVEMALKSGLSVAPQMDGNLTPLEERLLVVGGRTLASEVLVGAARWARLSAKRGSAAEISVVEVAAAVASPALLTFSAWVLAQAKKKGIKRLYFLSRDGWILKEMAAAIQNPNDSDVCELRYLYGSRQAWNPAAALGGDLNELNWLWDTESTHDFTKWCRRLTLNPEVVKEMLGDEFDVDDQRALRKAVSSYRSLANHIQQKLANERDLVTSYLRQEGLTEDIPWAIVDLGWNGNMQRSLSKLLPEKSQVIGFYFGLNRTAYADSEFCYYEAFAFDRRGKWWVGRFDGWPKSTPQVLESFCLAPHESVVGYERCGQRVIPKFRNTANPGSPHSSLVLEAYQHFLTAIAVGIPFVSIANYSNVPISSHWLKKFIARPSRLHSEAWGQCLFEHEQSGEIPYRLAEPVRITRVNLLRSIATGDVPSLHSSSWLNASWKLTPISSRVFFIPFILIGRLIRFLRFPLRKCKDWVKNHASIKK